MANTVTTLSYANTFGDWVIITDNLVTEINSLGKSNYVKDSGLLTLAGSGIGLQVANNALIQGNLQVTGTGQALQVSHDALISGNLVVLGNTTFSGYEIDYADITSNTIHSNVVTVNTSITGTNAQLNVSNNMVISGNLTVLGSANISLNEIVVGNVTANMVFANVEVIGQSTITNAFISIANTDYLYANTFNGPANNQIAQQISDSANASVELSLATALAYSIALG